MMRKNKLYTVNPWNRNLFDWGGLSNAVNSATSWKPGNTFTVQPQNYVKGLDFATNYNNVGQRFNAMQESANQGIGGWKTAGLNGSSSGGGTSKGMSDATKSAIISGITTAGSVLGNVVRRGDHKDNTGNALGTAGNALSTIGGATGNIWLSLAGMGADLASNLFFTYGVENEKAIRDNIAKLNNTNFAGNSNDDLINQYKQAGLSLIGSGKVTNGWGTDEGDELASSLGREQKLAFDYATGNFKNAVRNAAKNKYASDLYNYYNEPYNISANGGPLDTSNFGGALGIMQQNQYIDAINNRSNAIAKANTMQAPTFSFNKFDDGGFVDGFMQDPIAAAMNYIRQKDAEEAQAEAQAAQEAKEAEFNAMQTRLMNAETQNQGLQALLEDQGRSIASLQEAQALQNAAIPINTEVSPTYDVQEPVVNTAIEGTGKDDYSSLKNFIKSQEGFRSKAYWLKGEKAPTIGYGFHMVYPGTNRRVKMGDTMTREEAEQGLTTVLRGIDKDLSRKVPNWNILTSYQRDALRDLAYGTGTGGAHFRKSSRLMTALKNKNWEAAERELVSRSASLDSYNKALLRRSRQRQAMFREGRYAFGGELGTNGTDFTNGLLQVNAGNTHERNPFGGVPLGVDSQGVPNLVEEGETVFNDYVFSKRLKVPNFMLKDLGLGGAMQKGKRHRMSFADVSKKLAEESEMRPNDPISMNGLNASLSKLMEIQEAERMKQQAKMQNEVYDNGLVAACGGHLKKYSHGGNILDGKHGKSRLNTYSYDPIETFKYWDKDAEDYDEGYRDFIENKLNNDWINRVMKGQYGDMSRYKGANNFNPTVEEAWQLGLDRKNSDWHKAMAAAYDDYKAGINPITGVITPFKAALASTPDYGIVPVRKEDYTFTEDQLDAAARAMDAKAKADWAGSGNPVERAAAKAAEEETNPYTPPTYQTWMRYAPAVGAGIFALTDALGITNKPDYTYADKLEAAANRAGYAPNIQAPYIGDYMRYNPFDRLFYANQLQANARATDRALMNNSGANRGTAAAGLLANSYNTNNNLGNLYRQAEEYNRAQYERTKEFNRRTNMFNAQTGLEADLANARYRQQASQMGLSGLVQAANMRENIDARTGAARSANITNLLNNLGNIGRENFALNQINNDRSSRYGARANGSSFYKPEEARKKSRKNSKNS